MTYQDYILRHIQQAGRVWARIVRLIKDRQFETAHMVLDQAYRQLIGLSPEAVLERTPNDLIARLRFDESPAAGRDKCLALAMLLRASGDTAAAQGDSATAADAYHKTLLLLLDAVLRDPGLALPDYVPTVESLDAELSAHALPVTTQQELLLYYEQAGVYAKAEDILWAMLQAAPGDCELVGVGRALYARLQQLGDAALIAGNLPRAEVDGGLADLDIYAGEHGC
jgi:tetratricopeptide (TPR) repeat protein